MGTDCLKHQELATARARNWSKIELQLDLMWLHKISSESTHQVTDGADKQDGLKVLGKVWAGRWLAWKEPLDHWFWEGINWGKRGFQIVKPSSKYIIYNTAPPEAVSDFYWNQCTVVTGNTEIVGQSIFNQLFAWYCSIFNISLVLSSLWTCRIMTFYSNFQSSLKLIRNENVDFL